MAIIQSIPLSGSGGSSSTYTNMTTDEAIAGTNTEERVISAKVLNDAIDNKIPTIPTVNNAKLTIQKNGTTVKTFTANASANVTCNIEVPTKVSDLDNDSGFLTEHQDISGLETKANAITGLSVNGKVITYTKGDGSTGTITTQDTNTWTAFKGATSSANGTAGYVPAPTKGNQDKFFKADGTWATPTDTTYSVATTSTNGLMSSTDKTKLDGLSNYTLPTASSTLGGVKTTSTVTSTNGLSACPIIDGVPYYKDTNTTYNVATATGNGLMSKEDKTKLDGLSNYTLPTASSTLGGVKTTSTVTSTTGLTACPIVDGVPYYKDTNTTYTAMSASEATTGTSTTARSISAKVLNDKIDEKVSALVNSAPETLDTLNELASALGNDPNFATTVSNQIGNKADDDKVVHTSGAEEIAGTKTFTGTIVNRNSTQKLKMENTYIDYDVPLTANRTSTIEFYDKNQKDMARLVFQRDTNGRNSFGLATYNQSESGGELSRKVALYLDKENNSYFSANINNQVSLGLSSYKWADVQTVLINGKTPAYSSDIPDVSNFATKQEIPDISNLADDSEVVHKSGDESITGSKTFTTLNQTASKPYFNIKSTSADLDTNPSSTIVYGLRYYDKNNQIMSYVAHDQLSNGNNALIFQVYNKPLASESNPTPTTSSKRIGYYVGRDFNAYFAPSVSKASDLGSAQYLWGNVYSENYYGTNLGSSNSVFASSYVTTYYGTNIGTASAPFEKMYSSKIGSSATPVANLYATTIGAASSPVTDLYVTNFHGSIDSATKASQNASGNELSNTIIKGLSISGTTITYTNLDGTTGTLTTQDTNTTYSVATTSKNGLMSSTDKAKLDGLSNYTLPTASSTLGGVKTTSTVTDVSSYTACPIISGVPYYKDTNTTYSSMSASEATTGTATTARSISAKVLHDKISAMLSSVDFDITEAQIAAIVV